jgi:tetratricopeptide (TPR) repeat protein
LFDYFLDGVNMFQKIYTTVLKSMVALQFLLSIANAENINLMPKYGMVEKNEAQLQADKKFIEAIDKVYNGDLKKAAEDISTKGWAFLRKGDADTAIKRFNQALLLDPKNGNAIWGMGAVQGKKQDKISEAMQLFAEAAKYKSGDVDFETDYAMTIGFRAVQIRDKELLMDALKRYEVIYKKAPEHTLNIQNWAITLFYIRDYVGAWKKIQLAEATPRHNELDQNFIAALNKAMPRP